MAVTVTLIILIILILVLPGCNQKTKRIENTLRVSVVTYTHDDPFINAMVDDLKEELKKRETEERKIITSVRSADNDQKAQNEIVEEMIDAGCDILCVNLVDRTDPTTVIRLARQHDIPVIFFNREPVPEDLSQWNQLYYVGCEAKQSGEMQGEAGHQDAISRTDSSVKTLIEQGINLEKLSYLFADWNRGQAENRMNQIISQYGTEVEMVISNNDEMALGAIEAYKDAGYNRQEWPIIFGIDGLEDALEAIQNGTMQGTVYNDKEDQAEEMARLAVDIYDGKNQEVQSLQEEKYYVSQYCKVDISNVEDFIK